jgi:hypothetical protein
MNYHHLKLTCFQTEDRRTMFRVSSTKRISPKAARDLQAWCGYLPLRYGFIDFNCRRVGRSAGLFETSWTCSPKPRGRSKGPTT